MKIERPNWLNSILPDSSPVHVLLILLIILLILLLLALGGRRRGSLGPSVDSPDTVASSTQSASAVDSIKDTGRLTKSASSVIKITTKPKPKAKPKKVAIVQEVEVKFSAPFVIDSSTAEATTSSIIFGTTTEANGSTTPVADTQLSTTTEATQNLSDSSTTTTISLVATLETPLATTTTSVTSNSSMVSIMQEPMHVTMLGGGGGGAPAPTPEPTPPPPPLATVPDPVSSLDSSLVFEASVELTWTSPSDGGSEITGFEIRYSDGLSASTSVFALTSPNSITSLSDGITYFFEIYAGNSVGTSTVSNIYSTTTLVSAPPPPPD